MQTAEIKTSSAARSQIQAKRQPFFSKEGEGSFFSKSNDATSSFFGPTNLQPKLTIGQPNDKYEVEADTMADKVVQRLSTGNDPIHNTGVQGNNAIQRKCHDCEQEEQVQKKEEPLLNGITKIQRKPIFESNAEQPEADVQTKPLSIPVIQAKCSACQEEEKLQRKEEEDELQENEMGIQTKSRDTPGEVSPNLQSRLNSSKGRGSSLSPDVQTSMGTAFGANFGNVRIHTDGEAIQMNQEIGAQAFTHGSDIYFNSGKYDTSSSSGQHLLAHELTHTMQQGAAPKKIQRRQFGPGAQGVPSNWRSDVSGASTAAARFRLNVRAIGPGVSLVHRTRRSLHDASPNPAHLEPFRPGNKVNYIDNLHSKSSVGGRRSLQNNAGYTLHSGGNDYVVLGSKALKANNFYHARIVLNHEFDHVRQRSSGRRLRYTESELDAWTTSFIREFHRTYTLRQSGTRCYVDGVSLFAPLSMYYRSSRFGGAQRTAVNRISAYYRSVLRGHAAHDLVFRYWLYLSMQGGNRHLSERLNRDLSLNAEVRSRPTREIPCQAVTAPNIRFPAPPTLLLPSLSRNSVGSGVTRRKFSNVNGSESSTTEVQAKLASKPMVQMKYTASKEKGGYRYNSRKHLLAHELTHTVQQGGGRMNNQLRLNPESDAADEMLFYQNPYEVQVFAHVIRGLVFNFIDKGLYWKQGIMKGNQALASVLKALAGKEYTVQLVKDFHNNYTPRYYGGLQNIAEKEDLAKQFAFEVGLSMQIIDFLESKYITVNLTPEQRDILQQNLDINLFYKDLKDFNESDLPKWFTKSHFFIFSTTAGLKNEVRSYAINKPISHKDGDGAFEAEVKANEAYDKIYDSLIFYFNIFEALRQDEKLLDQGLYRGMWNLPAIDYSKKTQIKIGIASADASLDLRVAHTFALQCNTNTSAAKKAHKNNKEGHEARLDLMGMTGSKMIAAGLEKEAMGDVGLAEAINRYNAPPAPSSLKVYPSLRPPYFEMATKTEPVFEMNVQWADFYEALGAAFSISYVFDLIKIPDDKVGNIKKTHQGINEPAKGGAENHVEKGKPTKKEKGTFEKAEDELKDLDDIANDPKTEGEQQTLSDVIDQRYNRRVDYLAEDIETTVDDMEGIFGVPAGGGVIRLAMVGQAIGLIGDVISSFVDAIMMERYQKKVPIGKPGFYIVRAIAYNPDIPSDAKFVRAPSVAWMPIWAQSPENMSFTHLEHQLSVYEANKARIEKLESLLVSPINLSEEDRKAINKELAALKFHVFGTLTKKLKKEKEVLTTYKKQAKDDKEKERIENRIKEINNILETRKERIEENKNSDTSLETWFPLPAVFVDDKFGNVRKLSLEFIQKPAAKGKYKYFVSDLTTDKGGTEEGPEESSRVSAIREAVKEYMGEPDRYGRGYCTIQITPRKGTKDKPVAIVLRVKPKGKAIVMESIDNIASAINIVALVAAPFTGGASLVILLPVGLVGSIPAGYRLYNKYIDDTLRMDYGTAMDMIDIVGSLTAIGGKAADMAVAAGRMRMVPMQKGFAMVGLGADRLGYVVGSAQLLEDIKQIQSDDSLPPSLRRAKLMMRMGQELQTIGMVVGGKIYGDGKQVYDENKDLKPKQLPDSSTTKPADGDDASANKKPTKDTPEIDTDTDSNTSSDSTVKVPDSDTVAPSEKPVEKLKAKGWNDPLLTEQDFINQYEAAVADGSLKTTKKDPFERLAWLRQKYRDGWRFRPGKGWRKPFKKKVETAKKTKAKSDTQRTKDAATYLKTYPTRLLRGEGRYLQGLLDIHGNWKALIAQLESGGKKDQQIAKLLGQYRDQIVQDIIKTRNGEARTLPDASTRPESDIDLNFYGNDAGEKMLETEAQMEAAHGPDWSEKLRMNFYTESGRLTRYQDAQGSLSKDKKASWDDQITSYATLLNFAKMLLHAKGDKAAQKRIETLMESAGVKIDQVKGLTKESPSSRDAKRKALALEIDQLEDKYRTAKGDEKHELALKITLKQMEANFYSTEAYIGPGSVIKGKDKLTPTEAYQSMFSQLEMIEHVIHLLGGDIVKAMREYEIYKYMYRFSETVGAKQMDLFYDQLTKKLYKLDRDGAKGFTDTQILALWKDFHGYANKSIKNENITTTGALIDPRPPKEKFPDHLQPGESHTFEDRAKARRRKDGTLVIESAVGPGPGRKGYENKLLLGTEVGLEGWQRAHSHGQGTGHENPYGILYAPEEVNQQIQNRGIEAHIRELFISVPPEYTIHLTTETTAHPGTLRLKTIIYKLEISRMESKRSRLYEAEIGVADKRDAPKVTVEATPYGITDFKTTEPDLTPGPKADKKDLGKTHKKAQGALMNLEKLYTQLKTKNLDPSYKAYREILRNLRNDLLRNPSIDNVNNVNEAVKEIKSSLDI